jgi:hypothetical protein
MPTTYKVLGQSAPSATTATTLYTVPSVTSTVVSTVSVCNRDSASAQYRIAVRPAGATLANQHYIVYDASLTGNSTDTVTIGVTLATTDVVTVYASTANFSFSAFGSELS